MDEGFENLDQMLDALSLMAKNVQRRHVFGATMAAAKVVEEKAKVKAMRFDRPATPNRPDVKVYDYITTRKGRYPPSGYDAVYRVGVRGGASGKLRVPPTYWRYVEFGTEYAMARPFMRPAAAESATEAFNTFAKSLWARLDKELGVKS